MPTTASSVPTPPDHPFGSLLRQYRQMAGLSQGALAERAQMSVRAIGYLERGASRPYPDTLRRLAEALALTPVQQGALAGAVFAPGLAAPERAPAMTVGGPTSLPLPSAPLLVGRDAEMRVLRACLTAALAGRGSLALISGEAGIGKTTLAEAALQEAAQRGCVVLEGHCFDLADTPPYGPWIDLFARYTPVAASPPLPDAFGQRGTVGAVPSQIALFVQVQDFLSALAASAAHCRAPR